MLFQRIPVIFFTKRDLLGVVAPDGQTTIMGYTGSNTIFSERWLLKLNGPIKIRSKILAMLGGLYSTVLVLALVTEILRQRTMTKACTV